MENIFQNISLTEKWARELDFIKATLPVSHSNALSGLEVAAAGVNRHLTGETTNPQAPAFMAEQAKGRFIVPWGNISDQAAVSAIPKQQDRVLALLQGTAKPNPPQPTDIYSGADPSQEFGSTRIDRSEEQDIPFASPNKVSESIAHLGSHELASDGRYHAAGWQRTPSGIMVPSRQGEQGQLIPSRGYTPEDFRQLMILRQMFGDKFGLTHDTQPMSGKERIIADSYSSTGARPGVSDIRLQLTGGVPNITYNTLGPALFGRTKSGKKGGQPNAEQMLAGIPQMNDKDVRALADRIGNILYSAELRNSKNPLKNLI